MRIASPTAASHAATVMTKMPNTWPVMSARWREKPTKVTFTALSINSMDKRMMMALRRIRTPAAPMRNKTAPRTRK